MRIKPFIQTTLLLLTCSTSAWASEPNVSAKAYILVEAKTGQILLAQNEKQPLPPASTTKILTAIMALEQGNVEKQVKISTKAASVGEASIYLEPGENISILNLIKGALIKSGNDACVALAEYIGGSEEFFLFLMNRKAKIIGAQSTTFYNPNGLPQKGHLSTANDLALLARYGLTNKLFQEIVTQKEENIPWANHSWQRKLKNTNKLLWTYPGADGVKTGTTKEAGSCLVASATRNNRQLIAVVLNSNDRFGESAKLLDYGFTNTSLLTVSKNSEFGAVYVPNSKKYRIPLVTLHDYEFSISNPTHLQRKVVINELQKLHVQKGDCLGYLEIFDSTNILTRIPLVASQSST